MTIAPESISAVTDRERFCAIVANLPPLRADAAVVLCGEDALERAKVAVQILKTGGAPFIVLTGGMHAPPRWTGAADVAREIYAMGVSPDRILIDDEATNTREQAVNVVTIAQRESWHRLILCASPYHMPRAFLTFVQALNDAGVADSLHLVPVTAAQVSWFMPPKGMTETRADLYAVELQKIDEYGAKGHVASYVAGLAYLEAWDGR